MTTPLSGTICRPKAGTCYDQHAQLCRWKFSHEETLAQTFFDRSWNLLGTNSKIAFCATLWGVRGNVHGSSMARWKARGRLPISDNWTFFASSYGWGAMSGYWSKFWCLKGGWVTLSANFRWKGGHPPTRFCVKKLESLGYHVVLFAWSYV